jgi:hypothetical protein
LIYGKDEKSPKPVVLGKTLPTALTIINITEEFIKDLFKFCDTANLPYIKFTCIDKILKITCHANKHSDVMGIYEYEYGSCDSDDFSLYVNREYLHILKLDYDLYIGEKYIRFVNSQMNLEYIAATC